MVSADHRWCARSVKCQYRADSIGLDRICIRNAKSVCNAIFTDCCYAKTADIRLIIHNRLCYIELTDLLHFDVLYRPNAKFNLYNLRYIFQVIFYPPFDSVVFLYFLDFSFLCIECVQLAAADLLSSFDTNIILYCYMQTLFNTLQHPRSKLFSSLDKSTAA